jgi:TonB-linked SusC/RagA family outer membrane protein
VTNGSLEFSPVIPAEKNEDGVYPRDPYISLANPLNILEGHFHNSAYNELAVNAFGNYNVTSALSVRLRVNADRRNYTEDTYRSRMTYLGRGEDGIADVDNSNSQYYLGELTATYKKSFGSHDLEILGGSTYENFQDKYLSAHISGFPTDMVKTYNLGMGNNDLDNVGSSFSDHALLSYLGRINYTYADKYLFTFSFRGDGSSRFGEKNKFAYFPSGSFAWRLSEEDFLAQTDVISNLKLRTSYGITGNQAIGNYRSLSTFSSAGSTSLNNEPKTIMVQARIPNPKLKWESTSQLNLGLNLGIFDGRISGDFDYFVKRTTDMLYSVPVPSSSGFSSFLDNIGEMENKGIEASIRTANIVGGDFTWNTSLNFSHIENTVKDLGPVSEIVHGSLGHTPSVSIIKEGETMESYYGHEVVGMWQEGEDASNSAQPFAEPGFPKFKDQNNDGQLNDKDLVVLGDPFPEFTYGITNNFRYKNFNLSFFIRGVQGRDLLDNDIVTSVYPISEGRNRLVETWNNRWTPSNPNGEYPSHFFPHQYMGSQVNSFTVKDASFIRLSNIVLGYNIPVQNLNFINRARVEFVVNNVFTITDWNGYNPEMNWHGGSNLEGSYNAYPLPRTFSLGINVQF